MTDPKIIEAVARAIAESEGWIWDHLGNDPHALALRPLFRQEASAAIAAYTAALAEAPIPPMVPDAYMRAEVAIGLAQRPDMGLETAVAAAIETAYRDGFAAMLAAAPACSPKP